MALRRRIKRIQRYSDISQPRVSVLFTQQQAENEKVLKNLTEQCNDGIFATMAEAIDELDTPRVKSVKPYKTYDGSLTLGDPAKLPSAMNINVERYFKTHLARPLGASTVVVKSDQATQSTQTLDYDPMDGLEFSAVKQARTYKVNDPDAPGGKRDVEFESLAKGYEYGRTAVHISESEYNITKLETEKSFSIVGFVPWTKVRASVVFSLQYDANGASTNRSSTWEKFASPMPGKMIPNQSWHSHR